MSAVRLVDGTLPGDATIAEFLRAQVPNGGNFELLIRADSDDPKKWTQPIAFNSIKDAAGFVDAERVRGRVCSFLYAGELDSLEPDVAPEPKTLASASKSPPACFDSKGELVVPRLADPIKKEGHLRLGHDGRIYRYANGVYIGDGEAFVRTRVRELLTDRFRRRHTDEVMAYLRADFPSVTADPQTELLNTNSGLLDWKTGELRPHTPAVVSLNQIPVAWNSKATCPRIEKFLLEVLPEDALEFAFEAIGYALYAGNPLRVAIMLLGPGRNGKSVLLVVLTRLLGKANISCVPLQMFSENRFAAAEVFGKLANVCGDLDARAIKNTDIFKQLTGGDPILAERKFQHPFSFTSYALPIFSANEPPLSSDQTAAWFDRWLILPMENRIPEDQIDPHLAEKLTTPSELEGLLVKATAGLRCLMMRGRFEKPGSVTMAGEQYRDRLDSVRGFVSEECILELDAWVRRSTLYSAYRDWAKSSGRFPVSAASFNTHIKQNHPGQIEERKRRGHVGFAGLGLLDHGATE